MGSRASTKTAWGERHEGGRELERDRMRASQLLAWNLRRHRVYRGISQERLAAVAAMARGYVARMERGLENPTLGALDRLSEALSVPVAEFFIAPVEGEPAPKPLRGGRPRKLAEQVTTAPPLVPGERT